MTTPKLTPTNTFGKNKKKFYQMWIQDLDGVLTHVWKEIEESRIMRLLDSHVAASNSLAGAVAVPAPPSSAPVSQNASTGEISGVE